MFVHVILQEAENVAKADDAAGWNGRARRKRSECNQAHVHAARQLRRAVAQDLSYEAIRFIEVVAEPADDDFEHFGIARPHVDADASLFDLTDDHVDRIGRNAEARVDVADVEPLRRVPSNRIGDGQAARKSKS